MHPQFSPDGKMLAFSSDRSGQNLIYIMPATGGEAKAVIMSHSEFQKLV